MDPARVVTMIRFAKAGRVSASHRPHTPAAYRQEGEINAFDIVLREILGPRIYDLNRPATLVGGHALLLEFDGDGLVANCQCGENLVRLRTDQSLDRAGGLWEAHVMSVVDTLMGG